MFWLSTWWWWWWRQQQQQQRRATFCSHPSFSYQAVRAAITDDWLNREMKAGRQAGRHQTMKSTAMAQVTQQQQKIQLKLDGRRKRERIIIITRRVSRAAQIPGKEKKFVDWIELITFCCGLILRNWFLQCRPQFFVSVVGPGVPLTLWLLRSNLGISVPRSRLMDLHFELWRVSDGE